MAAPTDFRGTAYLQQSAPTVQAQVSNTTGCCNKSTCDNDCTQATFFQYHQNGSIICPRDLKGDRAGSLFVLYPKSVISSSSCPAFTRPHHLTSTVFYLNLNTSATTTTTKKSIISKINNHPSLFLSEFVSGGSFNLKSINKMQSVNVNCSLAVNLNNKGNNIMNSDRAVTEPKITTEPQRKFNDNDNMAFVVTKKPSANNSVNMLELVIVYYNGALILFPNQNEQKKPDIVDIPVVLLPIVQGNKYSKYPPKYSFKFIDEIDEYAFIMMNAESERKSGKQINTTITTTSTSNDPTLHPTTTINNNNDHLTNLTIKNKNDSYYTLNQLIAQQSKADQRLKYLRRPLRLCGGGENSLNTGTSGWGSPPAANSNNNNGNNSTGWGSSPASQNANNQSNWNNNTSRNNTAGQGSGPNPQDVANTNKSSNPNSNAAQNANPNQPPSAQPGNQGWNTNNSGASNKVTGANNPGAPNPSGGPGNQPVSGPTTTSSTKQQLEQLNSMREALFSQDGWGGQHVNQDTNWDIPSSPEPGPKEQPGGVAAKWQPPVNNGTELWEANLRNGGQPPAQPIQKTPWGHTPTTNIGGTWGEEDDATDSSNVWNGVPNNQQQWGTGAAANNSGMWSGSKKENDWGNNASGSGSGWGDPRADPRAAGMDPRDVMRANSMDPRNSVSGAADPRDPMRIDPRDGLRDPRDIRGGMPDMRGDPRGISGRLNGDALWGAPPHPPHQMGHHQPPGKMIGPAPNGVNQWPGPQPKEIGMPNKPSGWEEPSPPSQRRQMPNFDDGTSLWGNPAPQPNRMAGGPMGGRGNACPPGMASGNSRKPQADASLWGRNGSWGDDSQQHWNEEAWNKTKAPHMPWGGSEIDWHKPKQLTKEIVWNSKPFRQLVEMGHKKEDVENALRLSDMNLDDALDMLSPIRSSVDTWRNNGGGSVPGAGRHEDHGSYDHANSGPYGQRFGPGGPGQMQFPPSGNAPNLINNMGGGLNNPSLQSISSMSPAVVTQILKQAGNAGSGAGSTAGPSVHGGYASVSSQGRSQPPPAQSQPSAQQLRMLVQQIQMAVQAGYLNHQILNQPLAPQTLILLNQLLQHIKLLQTLMQQHSHFSSQGSMTKSNAQAALQVTVNITKTKQTINNLQNQIAANQAIYVKQQQMGSGSGQDLFKTSLHDPITAMQNNFTDLNLNKEPSSSYASQQQSRLNQWIKPDKEDNGGGEFSRAPGSIAKPPTSHSSPSMNLGLGQSDGPWSTGRSSDTGGWPDSSVDGPDSVKDAWPSAQASPAAFLDVVPEFEPGKPWKMKSIEDDPTITPGSIVRSPLSLASIKDTEIFSAAPTSAVPSKASPPVEPLSISSSTWSFSPSISTTAFSSPLNKIGSTKGAWDTPQPTAVTNELWGAPAMGKRGPPPGLGKGGLSGSNVATNGWSAGIGGGAARSSAGGGAWGTQNWGGSSWLLLRNLTAQIDGSTLQTLCKQHGPLQSFHLYSNHGFALAKYSSREEAIKAQTALNNCVLSNTTILAESPCDSEVNTLMQNLAQQSGSSGAGWRGGGGGGTNKGAPINNAGGDTWGNTCWGPNPPVSSSLWGVPQSSVDSDAQRATPSSLNSYLPGDLLGSESM